MKKAITLGVFLAVILAFALHDVSAYYYNYDLRSPHGTRIVYGFDGDFYAQDYRYVDYYGVPVYRVYGARHGNFDDDYREYVNKVNAVRFLQDSWYDRYEITAGKSSGDAFCSSCKVGSPAASNWGNKQAYNLLASGPGNKDNYYYKQDFDYNLGKFNWRF